jgi:ABC-type glycerol-3-phosphate transport system substrate-binding protein
MNALKAWNSKHPDIQVEGAYQGWDGYEAKLTTQFAANVAPDIMQISLNDLQQFEKDDLLLDLTKYKNTYFAGIDENQWPGLTYNGKIAAVSSGINGSASIYNKTLTDKYNLAPLTDDDTMDTLLEKCKKAVLDTNGDGKIDLWGNFDPMDGDPGGYNAMVKTFDLSVWTPDMKGCKFTDPAIINILKKYEQFRKAKVIVPPDITLMDGQSYMGGGYIVYDGSGLSMYPSTAASTKDNIVLGMPLLPFAGGKDIRSVDVGLPIAINNKCKNPDAAAKFLSWLLTDPEAAKITGMIRGVFPSKAQRDAVKDSLSNVDKSIVEVCSKLQNLGHPVNGTAMPNNYSQFLDIFTQEKNRYLLDQINLEQFMQNIQKAGSPVLAGN